jgi:hypothetical protein
MNILFTSSIGHDNNECPIIGVSSSNGFIPSRDTRIFVDKHKLQDIKSLIQRAPFNEIELLHQRQLYPFDKYSQLRQVRSKFDRPSTYLCYQFSSKYTNDICSRPLTIWTLADRSRNQDRDFSGVATSKLVRHIASKVWKKGAEASLDQNTVASLRTNAPNNKGK